MRSLFRICWSAERAPNTITKLYTHRIRRRVPVYYFRHFLLYLQAILGVASLFTPKCLNNELRLVLWLISMMIYAYLGILLFSIHQNCTFNIIPYYARIISWILISIYYQQLIDRFSPR